MSGEKPLDRQPLRADLHIHTRASDGRWTPQEVVRAAVERSIGLLAVADHDSTGSVESAAELACQAGLAFLRGVEVSSRLDGRLLHILGYGFDLQAAWLTQVLWDNTAVWAEHNDAVIHGLIGAGYPISWEDYEAYQYERALGGWKPLRFLIDRDLCTGIDDYFDRLLSGLSLPETEFTPAADVIGAIRDGGGVAVLAHPGASLRGGNEQDDVLHTLLVLGLGGVECYSHYHDRATTARYLEWCRRHGLLVTGGSDSHGGFVGREMGVPDVTTRDLTLGELADRIERKTFQPIRR
jgi:predicted metal-dependent phosphoesterase TrpH